MIRPWTIVLAVLVLAGLQAAGASIAIYVSFRGIHGSEHDLCPVLNYSVANAKPAEMTPAQLRGLAYVTELRRSYGCF